MKPGKKLLAVGLAGSLLSLGFLLYSQFRYLQIQELARPASGEGDVTETLEVWIGEESRRIEVELLEQQLGEEQTAEALSQAAMGLEKLFLNGNASTAEITGAVSMPSSYPDSDITLQWYLDSWEYVSADGTVKNESLTEPRTLRVRALLQLNGQTLDWEREIRICPIADPDTEEMLRILESRLAAAQEESAEVLALPEEILDTELRWYSLRDDRWLLIASLTVLTLLAMAAGQRQEEARQLAERERAMQLAYPDIVSRLSLYMGAGISSRKAWERIVENYRAKADGKTNPAYEEMCTAYYEMQSGVPEGEAYERFGSRCRVSAYLKLGTLLSQNLRRGTRNLSGLLEEESREAFENRKALAKKMGEECESRLLLPMMLMLLIVLVMVMYPAIVSFQV